MKTVKLNKGTYFHNHEELLLCKIQLNEYVPYVWFPLMEIIDTK